MSLSEEEHAEMRVCGVSDPGGWRLPPSSENTASNGDLSSRGAVGACPPYTGVKGGRPICMGESVRKPRNRLPLSKRSIDNATLGPGKKIRRKVKKGIDTIRESNYTSIKIFETGNSFGCISERSCGFFGRQEFIGF